MTNVTPSRWIQFFLVLILYCGNSWAGREVRTIPIDITGIFRFNVDSNGNPLPGGTPPAVYGEPARVGGLLMLSFNMLNLTNLVQTGTVEIVSKSVSARGSCQSKDAAGNLVTNLFTSEMLLCSSSGSGNHAGGVFTSTFSNKIPAPVTFTLGAQDDATVNFQLASTGTFGSTGPTCLSAWITLRAALVLKLNEDRGAVIASVTPKISGLNYNSPSYQVCGVGTTYDRIWSGDANEMPNTPIFVNGGRAF